MRLTLMSLFMIPLALGCGGEKPDDDTIQISELCTEVGERYAASEDCNGTAERLAELCEESRALDADYGCLDQEDALRRCWLDSDAVFECDIDGDEYAYSVGGSGDMCSAEFDAAFTCG